MWFDFFIRSFFFFTYLIGWINLYVFFHRHRRHHHHIRFWRKIEFPLSLVRSFIVCFLHHIRFRFLYSQKKLFSFFSWSSYDDVIIMERLIGRFSTKNSLIHFYTLGLCFLFFLAAWKFRKSIFSFIISWVFFVTFLLHSFIRTHRHRHAFIFCHLFFSVSPPIVFFPSSFYLSVI